MTNEVEAVIPPTPEEISAKLSSAPQSLPDVTEEMKKAELKDVLEKTFMARLKNSAEQGGYTVMSAQGLVEYDKMLYKVTFNTPAKNPRRQLRHQLRLTSGRQWRKFYKRFKLFERSITPTQRAALEKAAATELQEAAPVVEQ